MKKLSFILIFTFIFSGAVFASIPFKISHGSISGKFSENTSYQLCFTPGSECTQDIVTVLSSARKTVYVQAYSFTSAPIAQALVDAKARGVDVKVILDKSQYSAEKYSSSKFLANHGIPVWIDYKPSIAHNKVMIVDESIVMTGSFNFTKAAQEHNAENLLIIYDAALASQYLQNWNQRRYASTELANYQPKHKSTRVREN